MEAEELLVLKFIRKLQDPVPQYVIGCLPVIATIGAAPWESFVDKFIWLLRCLGCPFTGLFYVCCIKNDETTLCIYWLPSECFITRDGKKINYRPFGVYAMDVMDVKQVEIMKECVAKASVLERLSSLASFYYILVGVISGIVRVIGPSVCNEDWPSIPIALSWTLPAIFRRTFLKYIVVKDPNIKLDDQKVNVTNLDKHNKSNLYARVAFAALMSIVVPWISVLLVYFTPPIGFLCRSKYLSLLCSIWSFNSVLALLSHLRGEKSVFGNWYLHVVFFTSGILVAFLLFVLALLSNNPLWWVSLLGNSCDMSSICYNI
ncbi:17746_t:CDS:1 [Funneliformis caledonium]|uniref:17746_t:CDS:1 n=1 Tax=Funneliformis caledonium TaxID=1117310 RepID=A0A9N8WAK7_9GLOM|nr:17746_t:CDS:1 [Funneliformis caledonium]